VLLDSGKGNLPLVGYENLNKGQVPAKEGMPVLGQDAQFLQQKFLVILSILSTLMLKALRMLSGCFRGMPMLSSQITRGAADDFQDDTATSHIMISHRTPTGFQRDKLARVQARPPPG